MKQFKSIYLFLFCFFSIFSINNVVHAEAEEDIHAYDEDEETVYSDLVTKLRLDELEQYWQHVQMNYERFLPT